MGQTLALRLPHMAGESPKSARDVWVLVHVPQWRLFMQQRLAAGEPHPLAAAHEPVGTLFALVNGGLVGLKCDVRS